MKTDDRNTPASTHTALNRLQSQVKESLHIKSVFFEKNAETLLAVAELFGKSIRSGGKIMACGNGGSASDSQHFVGEMIGRFFKERAALPALALTCDTATLTAVANDYGYEQVFARQVDGLGREGDVLLAISTSGNSPNVLKAIEAARRKKMAVVGLTGKSGGAMAKLVDHHLCVELGKDSARIQETHIMVIHLLVDLVDEFYS